MIDTKTWSSLYLQAMRCRKENPRATIAYLEEALARVPELADERATMLNSLALASLSLGDLEKGESAIRHAMQLTQSTPELFASNLLIFAEILQKQDRHAAATDAGREGLRLVRQEYGWTHSYTIGVEKLLDQLGITYSNGWFLGFVPPRITSFFGNLKRRLAGPHH